MKKTALKRFLVFSGALFLLVLAVSVWMYFQAFSSNVQLGTNPTHIYIKSNATYDEVVDEIFSANVLENKKSFKWTANRMKLPEYFKPGKYELKEGMTNRELVNMIRLGNQVTVKYQFKSFRNINQVASSASLLLEPDSVEFLEKLNNREYIQSLGFDTHTVLSMFVPNTYYFKWNTSVNDFFKRMKNENDKFWDDAKAKKAERLGLSKLQVITLASIVEKETYMNDEKPIVAGVYINRYNKGMRLQADPTLIYAIGDFSIQRVLNKHKQIDSPYNTYRYAGLPPGPICSPSISSINAVLDYEDHDFLYFCAREDFSGYHNFAKTYSQHRKNAKKFQRELDKRNIRS